jgi:polar amino acid transport system substrate-binding protein
MALNKPGYTMLLAKPFLLAGLISLPILAADLAPTGTLRAVFLGSNPVQGRVDPQTGAVTGPVADLVKELAHRLGIPYVVIPAPDARHVIDTLKARAADIGFLAFDATRAEEVDFSEPYAVMYNTYLVRADSPIHKANDADAKGVRVGTVKGQTQQIYLSDHLKNAEVRILTTMPQLDELERMMLSGEIDAFGANRQRMEEAASLHPKLRVLADNFSAAEQAIVVRKEDRSSLDELNRYIQDLLASGFVKDSLTRAKLTGVEAGRSQIR